jgi:hypothetical protein
MNQTFAEILLFVFVAINAALLIFIAGVLGKVMNDMDEPAFKHFAMSLYRHSTRSLFMNTVLTVPFLGAIPYFYFYGFKNSWITAGLAIWLLAGSIGKIDQASRLQIGCHARKQRCSRAHQRAQKTEFRKHAAGGTQLRSRRSHDRGLHPEVAIF